MERLGLTIMVSSLKQAIYSKIFAKYFLVGGFNTVFGYLATVTLYYSLEGLVHIILICLLANVICITESFLMYKFLIFNSRGNWLHEYLRCYMVYGVAIVLGVIGLWLLVKLMHFPFWIAQGGLVAVSVMVSFLGHRNFTFRSNRELEKTN
jgi:putative flippase GtrA